MNDIQVTVYGVSGKFRLKRCAWKGCNPCNGWANYRFSTRNSNKITQDYYVCSEIHARLLAEALHAQGLEIL